MRKLIYTREFKSPKNPRGFALLPTVVLEAHPTHSRKWVIWLEWYEIDNNNGHRKWLIDDNNCNL